MSENTNEFPQRLVQEPSENPSGNEQLLTSLAGSIRSNAESIDSFFIEIGSKRHNGESTSREEASVAKAVKETYESLALWESHYTNSTVEETVFMKFYRDYLSENKLQQHEGVNLKKELYEQLRIDPRYLKQIPPSQKDTLVLLADNSEAQLPEWLADLDKRISFTGKSDETPYKLSEVFDLLTRSSLPDYITKPNNENDILRQETADKLLTDLEEMKKLEQQYDKGDQLPSFELQFYLVSTLYQDLAVADARLNNLENKHYSKIMEFWEKNMVIPELDDSKSTLYEDFLTYIGLEVSHEGQLTDQLPYDPEKLPDWLKQIRLLMNQSNDNSTQDAFDAMLKAMTGPIARQVGNKFYKRIPR